MNWDDIKFFLALMRYQRLSKAAKVVGTTHVTVANRVSALEDSLGVQLFVQDGHGFQLTATGKRFAEFAVEMEENLVASLTQTQGNNEGRSKVRIGVTEGLGDNYLSSQISSWMVGRSLDVVFISLAKTTTVTSREVDISITLEQPTSEFVIRRLLTGYELGIYASSSYLDASPPIKNRANLVDHPWIGYVESMVFSKELNYHYEVSEDLEFIFQSTSISAQKQATRQGLGLCILPKYIAKGDRQLIRVMPEVNFLRHYWIATNRNLHRLKHIKLVWNYIIECCQRDRTVFYEGTLVSRLR